MALKPLNDRVIVKRLEEEKKTAGGIIIPDSSKEKPAEGEVIAVGSKVEDVAQGNKVIFGKYSGTEVKFEGQDFLVMKEEEILAILG